METNKCYNCALHFTSGPCSSVGKLNVTVGPSHSENWHRISRRPSNSKRKPWLNYADDLCCMGRRAIWMCGFTCSSGAVTLPYCQTVFLGHIVMFCCVFFNWIWWHASRCHHCIDLTCVCVVSCPAYCIKPTRSTGVWLYKWDFVSLVWRKVILDMYLH